MKKELSFTHLNPTQFEEFCFELVKAMGFINVDWRKGTGKKASPADRGRDITCQQLLRDIDGATRFETWFLDCKHFTKGIPPRELENLLAWCEAKKPDVALIVASGFLSNGAKDYIEEYQETRHPPFRIKVWERPQLEKLSENHKGLLRRFNLDHTQSPRVEASAFNIASTLALAVAHELNNPVTAIIGYSALVLNSSIPAQTREDLQYVAKNATRCHEIIQNLVRFFRQERQQQKAVDLNKAVAEVLNLLKFKFSRVDGLSVISRLCSI